MTVVWPVFLWLLAAGTSARAQTTETLVLPRGAEKAEQPGIAFWALSPFTARRQLIIDGGLLEAYKGRSLDSLTVRRNGADPTELQGGQVQVQMWVSHATRGPEEMSPIFEENRGQDLTRVHWGLVTLPNSPRLEGSPAPWQANNLVEFRFRSPFPYKGGDLLIETLTIPVTSKGKQTSREPWWPVDAIVPDPTGSVSAVGTDCTGLGVQPAGAHPYSMVAGGAASFFCSGQGIPRVGFLALGLQDKVYGSFLLPKALDDLGAPGCNLYNELRMVIPVQSWIPPNGLMGLLRTTVQLPRDASVIGARIFAQWILPDQSANALGLVFSNGVQATIGRPPHAFGFSWLEALGPSAGWGEILPGRAPVLGFSFSSP